MEDYMGMKLKRKELEEVNDDFSDFSLSSPARKIRRLDAELPPIIEEDEADFQLGYEQSIPGSVISNGVRDQFKAPIIEELPSVPENEEKAIVLFKPMNSPLFYSPSNLSVDPNLISSFKNQSLWGNPLNSGRPDQEEEVKNGNNREVNTCKAVIPWVPSQQLNLIPETHDSQTELLESMDAEETEEAAMEIEEQEEDASASNAEQQASTYDNFSGLAEPLQHQWPQQHCMIPQPPQNIATPIVWYR